MAKKIPEWNYQVLKNNFEDSYWIRGVEDTYPEAFKALSNLNKKYNSYSNWVDACQIYDRYIGDMYEYYGGELVVKAYYKEHQDYPPGVVQRPSLLMKKKIQKVINGVAETGVEPSRFGEYIDVLTVDEIDDVINDSNGNLSDQEVSDSVDFKMKDMPKKILALAEEVIDKSESSSRVRHIYNNRNAPSYDIITAFYDNHDDRNADCYDFKNKSIDDIVKEVEISEYEEAANGKWVRRSDEPEYHYRLNRILNRDAHDNIQVAKVFASFGINPITKKMKKHMDDVEIKMMRSELGDIGPLSKEEIKAAKKQAKVYEKQREGSAQRRDSDSALGDFLTTRFRIEDFNDRMVVDDLVSRR